MISNKSMPGSTIIPKLGYPDIRRAVEWLISTFGFQERLRMGEHRAQLCFGSGHLIVMQGPESSDDAHETHAVMVRVPDLDAHCARATEAGARITRASETFPYGERQYSALDIGGHVWTFSQSVADVDPSIWGGDLNEDAA